MRAKVYTSLWGLEKRLLLLPLLGLCLAAPGLGHAELHVWTVTETRHVLRSEPGADQAKVALSAGRNEHVDFQICLRSDTPIPGINLESEDLTGQGDSRISRAEARLYRQHQLHLTTGTYRNDAFKPDWYPDPLIPFENPITRQKLQGGRLSAVPFSLPADQTHGFWVDWHVPANAPAGEYHGTYRLATGGRPLGSVIVSLTVWNFTLPQTPTLVTEFGSPDLHGYYREQVKEGRAVEPSDWAAVEAQCAQLLSDHCFNAVPPAKLLRPESRADGSFEIPPRQIEGLRSFIDQYHVNALQVPHPASAVKDPVAERDRLRGWLAAFDHAAAQLERPGVLFYTYLRDEPNTREDYRYVQLWGRAIREARSVVKVLVVEQPWTAPGQEGADSAWGDLYGAVDIWCPLFSLHHPDSAARRLDLGEKIWTYTALCQGPPTPWWHIDFPLLNYRVPAWMAGRDGLTGLLYWGGMAYWRESADPWTQAPRYTGNGQPQQGERGIVFNGEGSLVYPAHDVGFDGIVPSIRLKALRRAIQDYEYLSILQRLGRGAEAQKIVRGLTASFFQWDKAPSDYERARARMAALILEAQGVGGRK